MGGNLTGAPRSALAWSVGLGLAALATRLVLIAWFPLELGDDGFGFVKEAGRILAGNIDKPPKYPLHMLLLMAGQWLLPMVDPFLVGRLISALSSALLVGCLAALAHRAHGAMAAVASAVFATFTPWFMWNSVSTSAEPLFSLAVVAFVLLVTLDRTTAALLVAGAGSLVRFEGFVLLGVFVLLFGSRWWQGKEAPTRAVAGVVAGFLAAASIFGVSWMASGDATRFLTLNIGATLTRAIYPEQFALRLFYPAAFYFMATPVVALLCALGTIRDLSGARRTHVVLYLTVGCLWLFQVSLMALNITITEMRYLLYGGLLLMVPAGGVVVDLVRYIQEGARPRWGAAVKWITLAALVVAPALVQARTGYEICRRAHRFVVARFELGERLAELLTPTSKVFLSRRQRAIVAEVLAGKGLPLNPVYIDYLPPGQEEETLLGEGVDFLVYSRSDRRMRMRFPQLDGERIVQGKRLRFEPVETIRFRTAPSAHLAPGTYAQDSTCIIYAVKPVEGNSP